MVLTPQQKTTLKAADMARATAASLEALSGYAGQIEVLLGAKR